MMSRPSYPIFPDLPHPEHSRDDSALAESYRELYPSSAELSPDVRLLSRADCATIIDRVIRAAKGGGGVNIAISGYWNGELRWARNRVSLSSDRRDIFLSITRNVDGGSGRVFVNQLDDVSLTAAVGAAEYQASRWRDPSPPDMPLTHPVLPQPTPTLWSDATYNVTSEQRGGSGTDVSNAAEENAMLAAGYIETRAWSFCEFDWPGDLRSGAPRVVAEQLPYVQGTQAQCSMTVRHPKGTASGWAGLSNYDWTKIDGTLLAQRALKKCLASLDPVRIEPGRYTVVLEPQAVCDLVDLIMGGEGRQSAMDRESAELGRGPFTLGMDSALGIVRSKLGMKIIDERLTISHDPMDPQLGVLPDPGLQPITWFEKGHLTALTYRRDYALAELNENLAALDRAAYRMSGGDTPVDEMIQTTSRGLLVTRFSNLRVLDGSSLLSTGVTRDGLWLIEKGKITKAVKNMRITESPLFVLNQVEQLGEPVPVFRPLRSSASMGQSPAIVPALKVRDFSFTATLDAI